MALKDLLTDLSNFRYTDYGNAGSNQSQISGRHGTIDAPIDNTDFDNGVGRGVDPNSEPQSFTVRGYQVTGNKRFYIGLQGDLIPRDASLYGAGTFDGISGVFDFTQTRDRLRVVYSNYGNNEFSTEGSVHIGSQDTAGIVGGGLNYYGSLVTITPRNSIYRDDSGNYRVPQEGKNTNPPGGISNIPLFDGTQITHNIPQITLTGPYGNEDYQSTLNTTPRIPDLHGSDFMTQPSYTSQIDTNTATHNVSMITLSGPTSQAYQTQLNIVPVADGAHGSDFSTTPIESFSSRFATQDGLLMDTVHDSGFNRDGMYIVGQSEPSTPEFKVFSRTDTSLKRISLDSPNFDSDGNKFFTFADRIPYNIPARDDSAVGFDQPFILRPIGNTWGFDKPNGEGFFSKVGGFLNEIDSAVGDITRGAPGFTGLISRTLHDAVRLGKFALTTKGIFFVAKQYGLQLLNPRPETRVYNPLSLSSIAPIVHMDRHLDGGTYEEAIGPRGTKSILTDYADAVQDSPAGISLIEIPKVTAKRVTLAHVAAMVPGAGGKVSFGALPEIKFNLLRGNIDSLVSSYPISTNPIAFQGNTFSSDSRYDEGWTFEGGTSGGGLAISGKNINKVRTFGRQEIISIESGIRQEEAIESILGGWDPPIFSPVPYENIERGEMVRSPIARQRVFWNNGNTDIPAGSYAIYDTYADGEIGNRGGVSRGPKVIRPGIMIGNIYTIGDQYYKHNVKYPLNNFKDLTIGKSDGKVSEVLYEQTEPMIFKNRFIANDKRIYADTLNGEIELGGNRPIRGHTNLSRIYVSGRFQGDRYDRSKPYSPLEIPNAIQDKPGVDSTREDRLKKGTIQLGDFAIYNKRYFHNNIQGEGPVVPIGGRDTLNTNGYLLNTDPTLVRLKRDGKWASDLYGTDTRYGSLLGGVEQAETEPKDFTTTKLTIDENGEPQLTFSLPYNNLDSEASQNRSLAFNLQTRTGNIRGQKVKLSDYKDFSWATTNLVGTSVEGIKFVGNKYGPQGSKRYGNISYSTNKPYHKSAGTWGKIPGTGEGEEGVYDWSDLDVGDSVGGLTMVHKEEQAEKRNVRDNPVVEGPQGGSIFPKNIPINRPQDSSRFENLELPMEGKEQEIPTVVKTKVVQDDNAPTGIEPNPDITLGDKPAAVSVPATSVSPDKKSAKQSVPDQPAGNKEALKRYKTLSYGDLGEGSPKRYNQEWLSGGEHQDDLDSAESQRRKELFDKIKSERSDDNKLVYRLGNPGTPGVTAVYDDTLMGKIKPGAIDGSGKVTSYNGDMTDKVNMTPYGDDNNDDFIKFKFYDVVNKKHLIFRATLNGISETLSPEWSSERYIGRPDNVHVYQGVDRSLSFNFIVAPTTRQELPILWEKLNYLVGMTYPTWSPQSTGGRRMESPFMTLTIGDMYVNTPGYLGGLGVEIDDNSTWEITDGMQLPKVINVSCEFTHIGQHALASQGKHYDLAWLKEYNPNTENWKYDDQPRPDAWKDFYSKIGSAVQTD